MSVTVSDLRTTRDEADATTNWGGGTTATVFTADPPPIEATGHLGIVLNNESGYIIHVPGGSVDLSSTLVYSWLQPGPAMAPLASGGFGIVLSDGTNIIQFNLGGSDVAVFRHNSGVPTYNCMVLDTASLPASTFVHAGTVGALNLAAITGIGIGATTTLKAVGGTANVFLDVIRYGTGGIVAFGGTIGDEIKFSQIADDDALTSNTKALGVMRKLAEAVYGLQGPLTIGTTGTISRLLETNQTIVFEDRGFLTTRYLFKIEDDGTNGTIFQLGTKVGSGITATGKDGCVIIVPVGVGATFEAKTALANQVFIYGTTLSGFTGGLGFSSGQEFIGGVISGSGKVLADGATMVNTAIVGSTVAINDSALRWDVAVDPDTHLHGMSYQKGANAHHAIELGVNSPTTVTLRDVVFTGFNALDAQDDSAIHVRRTSGTVTINIVGGSGTPSFKSDGATVDIVQNPVTLTITVRRLDTGVVIEGANVYVTAAAGGPLADGTEIIKGLTDVNGQINDTRTYSSDQPITGWVRKATSSPFFKEGSIAGTISSTAGLSLTVQMASDE